MSAQRITRRGFVRAAGVAGASALWGAQILARGHEAAVGEGLEWQPAAGSAATRPVPVRLSSNENPVGPPRVAVDALIAALSECPRYPGGATQRLIDRLAAHHAVPAESIVAGSGSGEILRMAVHAWVSKDRPLVAASPTFEEPGRYAEVMGAPVVEVPVTRDLLLDLDAMAERARGAGLVFLCNPNNPTGTVHGASAVAGFVERVQRLSPETTVLIDEAYHHYVEDPAYATAVPLALDRRNVVVCRTFSKLYGMAGLRLGYAIARAETISALRRQRLANSVNVLVAPAAEAALADTTLVARERARNHEAREFTRKALAEAGFPSRPSEANFILVDIRRDVRQFQKACSDHGVLIGRPFPPLLTHARISIGTMDEMAVATRVFRKILSAS